MAEILTQNAVLPPRPEVYYPGSTEEREIVYPEQREDDMGETSIHVKLVAEFLQMLLHFFQGRKDVFLSANMNLYYEEETPTKWLAPDILIAFGVDNHERTSYQVWKEPTMPQVIFEVSSERTWKNDISEKLEVYSDLGVEEYYNMDPEFAYLPAPMLAYHRLNGRLMSVPIENERIFSPRLGLEIVRTESDFRLFDPATAAFLLTLDESEERRLDVEAENESLRIEIEKLKAER